jgi:site-specific recombinase XerD
MFPQTEIDDFRKYWKRRRPGRSTAVHYSSDVTIFFKWAQGHSPESVTARDVDRFVEWQHGLGRAPATITRRLIAVRRFYDYWAYAHDQALPNPVIPHRHYVARGAPLPRDVTEEVIQRLFHAIGNHVRDRALFTLMLHAGLRVGEVAQLRLTEIELARDRHPHLRLQGKGQRERLVYLSATAVQYLQEYLATRSADPGERVFLNRRGQPISVTGIQWQLAQHCRRAGIWITCHQLRHTFASRLIAADVPITSVQKLLGHTSLRTTQLYIRVADVQVERDYHAGIQKVLRAAAAASGEGH